VLADKVGFLSTHREELHDKYTRMDAANKQLRKELEEKRDQVKTYYNKLQLEKQVIYCPYVGDGSVLVSKQHMAINYISDWDLGIMGCLSPTSNHMQCSVEYFSDLVLLPLTARF
jgi:hypothetical protein